MSVESIIQGALNPPVLTDKVNNPAFTCPVFVFVLSVCFEVHRNKETEIVCVSRGSPENDSRVLILTRSKHS